MIHSLLKDTKISRVGNSAAAGTSDVIGSTLDMAGWDGVTFVALLGDVTNGSVLSLQIQEGAAANGSDAALPTGGVKTADFTADATSGDNNSLVAELYRPQKRYLTPVLKRGTANAVVDGIIAVQWRGRVKPVTQPAGVLANQYGTGV